MLILTGAIPFVVGTIELGWIAALADAELIAAISLASVAAAFGFALSGLGLLALTRQKDRAQLLARTTAFLLGILSFSGLMIIGLHSVSPTNATPPLSIGRASSVLVPDFDLPLSLGFLATAVALGALTLNGRKRAGAAMAAALAVTVGIIGLSAILAAALSLRAPGASPISGVFASTLFVTIGFGLYCGAKRELVPSNGAPACFAGNHSLSIVIGACLGLITLSALLILGLAARDSEDIQRAHETNHFREILHTATASLNRVEKRVDSTSESPDPDAFNSAMTEVHESLRQLSVLARWPEHQQLTSSLIAQIKARLAQLQTAFNLRREGRNREAIRRLAAHRISHPASEFMGEFTALDEALRNDANSRMADRADRRRNTAIVLSATAGSIVILLGAVHFLFQRESLARQRSEGALRRHNETLKSFAHTIAHDLRAPLRGIAGYAAELDSQARTVDARGRHCINQINTAAQNLERMIGDTLNYAQLDAETPNMSTLSLPNLVAALLQQRAPEIRRHGTIVDTHFGIVTVTSWERGLVQIIGNLLDNSIKYSRHAHPPRVRIETAQTPLSWRLVIYDNGVGFDMKYHDRIFGLFQRLVTTDEFEGTGAGLAIVRKITDRLGGTVRAEGRPGGGATFLVELPRILSRELA